MNQFKILHKQSLPSKDGRSGKARVGQLKTAHGVIETPNFIPVGTLATVKAMPPRALEEIGIQIVLANTYHLMLRPGADLIEKMGGLHKFMNWDKPIMTDSGGFQVFSLGVALEHGVGKLLNDEDSKSRPRLNQITEEGVIFQSHLDGSKHILTPEKSIKIQKQLGADLIVAFDDLESPKYSYEETLKSLELSERWELRSKGAFYGVTHGGVFEDLRIRSARFVDKHFEGIALGGAHKDKKTLYQVVNWTVDNVSDDKPRHLLGIGEVEDLIECSEKGVDLFDCVAPMRRARNGSLYISKKSGGNRKNNFTLNISQSRFTKDSGPIDISCECYTCKNFSKAYLRHLYMSKELLYHYLATHHNIYFINNLMQKIREAIYENNFPDLKTNWLF